MNPLEQLKSMRADALRRLEASSDYKLVHALQPLIEELENASDQDTDEDGEASSEPASSVTDGSFEIAAAAELSDDAEVVSSDDLGGSIEEALEMAMSDAVSADADNSVAPSEAEIDFEAVKAQLMESDDAGEVTATSGNGYDKSYS